MSVMKKIWELFTSTDLQSKEDGASDFHTKDILIFLICLFENTFKYYIISLGPYTDGIA